MKQIENKNKNYFDLKNSFLGERTIHRCALYTRNYGILYHTMLEFLQHLEIFKYMYKDNDCRCPHLLILSQESGLNCFTMPSFLLWIFWHAAHEHDAHKQSISSITLWYAGFSPPLGTLFMLHKKMMRAKINESHSWKTRNNERWDF